MSQRPDTHTGNYREPADEDQEALKRQLVEGIDSWQTPPSTSSTDALLSHEEDNEENKEVQAGGDLQGALGLFAEAAQDMATAGLEHSLGRHFACVDYCNQVAEKAAQAVSLLYFGRRSSYDHDLRTLGAQVNAPLVIQDEMDALTPFHPEAFYADTPPEEADEVISAEQANGYLQSARHVLRWARSIIV